MRTLVLCEFELIIFKTIQKRSKEKAWNEVLSILQQTIREDINQTLAYSTQYHTTHFQHAVQYALGLSGTQFEYGKTNYQG